MSEIEAWLQRLGLDQYSSRLVDAAIDLDILSEITEADLENLDIPLGDRKRLLKAIARLPSPLVDESSQPPAERSSFSLEGERRQLTVMFVDMVGSTAMSTRLDPEEMRDVIREYQNVVAGEVARFEGHVAKFMGDGVMVYFGWPHAHEDDAERAVRAGLALMDAVARIRTPEGQALTARTGIATGLVVVGDLVGEGTAQEESVIGETPNLAARLQGAAAPGQVVIAEGSRRLIGDVFQLADLGELSLKGISDPVQAFTVEAERLLESRFDARVGPSIPPLVGRQRELEQLIQCWTQAKTSKGQAILLEGEPGFGKSRLVQALLEKIKDDDHERVLYQCSPYHSRSALYPVKRQLASASELDNDQIGDTKLERLESFLRKTMDDAETTVPLIAALFSIDARYRHERRDVRRQRTLGALIHFLLQLASKKALLLVVEDAQWIDPTSQELIDRLGDCLKQTHILILITTRPRSTLDFRKLRPIRQLSLDRLSHEQALAIVHRITDGISLPDAVLTTLLEKCDGIPLFIEEVAKSVLESGALKRRGNTYVMQDRTSDFTIPDTIKDSLMARLDRLHQAKAVAQMAAVIGREFDYDTIRALAHLSETKLDDALERLVIAELISRQGKSPKAGYVFKHSLVRDVAYDSLLKRQKQKIHARLLNVLKNADATAPEELAQHAEAGGLDAEAIRFWQLAGKQALERPAYAEAISHFENVLRLLGRMTTSNDRREDELAALIGIGQASIVHLGYSHRRTSDVFKRAFQLASDLGNSKSRLIASYGLWVDHHTCGRVAEALPLAHELVSYSDRRGDDEFKLMAHRMMAVSLTMAGELDEACAHAEQALALYEPSRHAILAQWYAQDPGVGIRAYWSHALWAIGRPVTALSIGKEALELARLSGHVNTLGYALVQNGILAFLLRDQLRLIDLSDELQQLSAQHDMRVRKGDALVFRGLANVEQGAYERAVTALNEGLKILTSSNSLLHQGVIRANQALALVRLNRPDEAEHELKRAEELTKDGERFALAEIQRIGGVVRSALQGSNPRVLEAACMAAIATAQKQNARSFELRATATLAQVWTGSEKSQETLNTLKNLYDDFKEGFETADLRDVRSMLAALA